MFFGFGTTLLSSILFLNAIAILSEDRFLARIGWLDSKAEPSFGQAPADSGVKARLINWMNSVRTVMRLPLMFINTVIIIYLLALG